VAQGPASCAPFRTDTMLARGAIAMALACAIPAAFAGLPVVAPTTDCCTDLNTWVGGDDTRYNEDAHWDTGAIPDQNDYIKIAAKDGVWLWNTNKVSSVRSADIVQGRFLVSRGRFRLTGYLSANWDGTGDCKSPAPPPSPPPPVIDIPECDCTTSGNSCFDDEKYVYPNAGLVGALSPTLFAGQSCVKEVDISGNALTGSLPSFADTMATKIDVSGNKFSGALPPLPLDYLELLDASNNDISGTIPTTLFSKVLNKALLYANELSGCIPSEIGDTTALEWLDVENNNLDCMLPSQLQNQETILNFKASGNKFPYPLQPWMLTSIIQKPGFQPSPCDPADPSCVNKYKDKGFDYGRLELERCEIPGMLPAVPFSGYTLHLDFNQLSGSIPYALGDSMYIHNFFLNDNSLTGSIPSSFGLNTAYFKGLHLENNGLSGSLPDNLFNAITIEQLYLSNNMLTGSLDAANSIFWNANISSGARPLDFYVDGNKFTEMTGAMFAKGAFAADDTRLRGFRFFDNPMLDATIPTEIGYHTLLKFVLGFKNPMLDGTLPTEVGQLAVLEDLKLSETALTGCIPTEINGCADLEELDLSETKMGCAIPTEIGELEDLVELQLSNSDFDSPIPSQIGGLSSAKKILLTGNDLVGPLPSEIGSLSFLLSFDASKNSIGGMIPSEVGTMSALTSLDLSFNDLTGCIPSEIGSLSNLVYLVLAENELSCPIPDEFCNLASIMLIDLKENKLTGPIPDMFYNLDNLDCFVVQGNYLTGKLPKSIGYPAYVDCILTRYETCESGKITNTLEPPIEFRVLRKCDITICNSPPPPSRPNLPPLPPPPPPPEARETPPSPPPPPPESEPPCPPKPEYTYVSAEDFDDYFDGFKSGTRRTLAELVRALGVDESPVAAAVGGIIALVAVVAFVAFAVVSPRGQAEPEAAPEVAVAVHFEEKTARQRRPSREVMQD